MSRQDTVFKTGGRKNTFATLTFVVGERFHTCFICLGYTHPLFKVEMLILRLFGTAETWLIFRGNAYGNG